MPPAVDLFSQLDQLFRHQKPEGKVDIWALHRFLASDPDFAPVVKELAPIWDVDLVIELWRTVLPRSNRAPRLGWTGPKRSKAALELTKKIAEVEGWSIRQTEENLELLRKRDPLAYELIPMYYGVEEKKK